MFEDVYFLLDGTTIPGYSGHSRKGKECQEDYNFILEEVEQFEYFDNFGIPNPGIEVFVKEELFEGRLIVFSTNEEQQMGTVPVIHNELKRCLESGLIYKGKVVHSSSSPLVRVAVILHKE